MDCPKRMTGRQENSNEIITCLAVLETRTGTGFPLGYQSIIFKGQAEVLTSTKHGMMEVCEKETYGPKKAKEGRSYRVVLRSSRQFNSPKRQSQLFTAHSPLETS
jgi:hypothetical protein